MLARSEFLKFREKFLFPFVRSPNSKKDKKSSQKLFVLFENVREEEIKILILVMALHFPIIWYSVEDSNA